MAYTPHPHRDDTTGYYRADPQITETATVLAKAYCPYCNVQVGEASGSRLDLSHLVGAVADHVAKAHTPQTGELQVALRANKELTEQLAKANKEIDFLRSDSAPYRKACTYAHKTLTAAGVFPETGDLWDRVGVLVKERDEARKNTIEAVEKIRHLQTTTTKAYDNNRELVEKIRDLIKDW